ncbi:hypothetical protein [Novosphingobium terrae]|uniref:hypothetical protein n=1 Tax=Novosphingobium terrae TaxID=2726189 RepID=UPI00197F74AF|nr:hypothetical protein [Novosphingobium terrae]
MGCIDPAIATKEQHKIQRATVSPPAGTGLGNADFKRNLPMGTWGAPSAVIFAQSRASDDLKTLLLIAKPAARATS